MVVFDISFHFKVHIDNQLLLWYVYPALTLHTNDYFLRDSSFGTIKYRYGGLTKIVVCIYGLKAYQIEKTVTC